MTRLLPLTFGKADSPSVRPMLPRQQEDVSFALNLSRGRKKKLKPWKYLWQAPSSCKGEGESPHRDSRSVGIMRWRCLCKGQALPSAAHPRPPRLQTPRGGCLGRVWPGMARPGSREPIWAGLLSVEGNHLAGMEEESLWLRSLVRGSRLSCGNLPVQSCCGGLCHAWRESAIICSVSEFSDVCISPRLPLNKLSIQKSRSWRDPPQLGEKTSLFQLTREKEPNETTHC